MGKSNLIRGINMRCTWDGKSTINVALITLMWLEGDVSQRLIGSLSVTSHVRDSQVRLARLAELSPGRAFQEGALPLNLVITSRR
jgi:hypothetical protein